MAADSSPDATEQTVESTAEGEGEPAPPESARVGARTTALTAAVVVAMAAVWAVGLGVVDRTFTPAPRRYSASPTARVERRPALFVFQRTEDAAAGQSAVPGYALPLAVVEPSGALRPPFDDPTPTVDGRAQMRAFRAIYCAPGVPIQALGNGAAAGSLTFEPEGPADEATGVWVRGACQLAGSADPTLDADGLWLAISDTRFGRAVSGASPMRAIHRAAVETMTKRLLKERFADRHVDEEGPAEVRLADLDHTGHPEILATRTVRLRDAGGRLSVVSIFFVGEALGDADSFHAAFAVTSEGGASEENGYDYVDQIDLTPAPFDEIVIRHRSGDTSWYGVLRRDDDGKWREAYTAGPIRAPGRSSR
jgi:hypothetical protein